MKKKIVSFIISILLVTTTITVFKEIPNVKAESSGENDENVGLDYDFIYEVTEELSDLIFTEHAIDHGIWKGRTFGTPGEIKAMDKIKTWIVENTDNLTSNYTIERVGDEDYGYTDLNMMRKVNNKMEILGYYVDLREGYSGEPDVIIPNNESFIFPKKTYRLNWVEHTIDSGGPVKIHWPPIGDKNNSQDGEDINFSAFNLNITTYNVSYTLLNSSGSFVTGNMTYLENYSNATAQEKAYKIHLINVSDEEYNNTVDTLENDNATGFILIRDNVINIEDWMINIPGVAVSQENGSFLINLSQNGIVDVYCSDYNISTNTGTLNILHCTDNITCFEKEIYIVNATWLENRFEYFLKEMRPLRFIAKGFLLCSPDYPQSHFQYPYSTVWSGIHSSFSRLILPIISINGSVIVNGEMKDVWEWVEENYGTENPVTLNFSIDQRKNPEVESYNIYCDVVGKNSDETFIMSGGHYDGWYGQSTCDNAVGIAQMLGVLKYFNDNSIVPKYTTRFIFHAGEENVARGSMSHVFNISNRDFLQKANYIINLCQLGHKFPASFRINTTKLLFRPILTKITEYSNYDEKYESKNYQVKIGGKQSNGTVDCVPYARYYNKMLLNPVNLKYVNFCKDNYPLYHLTGYNHTVGDTMNALDVEDINATVDVIWNATKYFIVDPDCWFENLSYECWDKPNDGDSLNDSVNVSFSIKSILPNDRSMVKATLISEDHPVLFRKKVKANYIVNTSTTDGEITVTLPKWFTDGEYNLKVYLYNSTGEINREILTIFENLDFGIFANGTYEFGPFYLHPSNSKPDPPHKPSGETEVNTSESYPYTTNTTDIDGDSLYYQWQWDTFGTEVHTTWFSGPYQSGENCTQNIEWISSGSRNISVRAKDHVLSLDPTNWSTPLTVNVSQSDNSNILGSNPLLNSFSANAVAVNQQTSCTGFNPEVYIASDTQSEITWLWDFGDGNTSNESKVSHNYSQVGNYTVNLTLSYQGDVYNASTVIEVLPLKAGYNTSSDGAQPDVNIIFNDTSKGLYDITNYTWNLGDGNVSYEQNVSHSFSSEGVYNVSLTVKDQNENVNTHYQIIHVETTSPAIIYVDEWPHTVDFGSDVTIYADFYDNESQVDSVSVNITYPDKSSGNFTMSKNLSCPYDFEYVFNDTWLMGGLYSYSIWVYDHAGNSNVTGLFNFSVTANATISICAIKDTYGANETINITDPPGDQSDIGYELLDDDDVLHIWNNHNSYYFNTSSGIQLTNHYNDYWSHNVLMLGYYNNDMWNLIYRTDELSGFNKDIYTDNETYVNATLWKDLTYSGYDFRLALRYHLGVDDNELTVIPYIKNLGDAIPYTLGFAWEINDVRIADTIYNNSILINCTEYQLNQTLDLEFTNLTATVTYWNETTNQSENTSIPNPMFVLRAPDPTYGHQRTLYLKWNESLNYLVRVKNRTGQYNAPTTLFIKIGTLDVDQEKYTKMYWLDSSTWRNPDSHYDYGDGYPYDWENEANAYDDNTGTSAGSEVQGAIGGNWGGFCSFNLSTPQVSNKIRYYVHSNTHADIDKIDIDVSQDGEDGWTDVYEGSFTEGQYIEKNISGETVTKCIRVRFHNTHGLFTRWAYLAEVDFNVANAFPIVAYEYPSSGSIGIPLNPVLSITVSDDDKDYMNITWLSNHSGSWQVFGTNNSVRTGIYHQTFSNASVNGKWWYWKVNVTDGIDYTVSVVYKFYTGVQSKIVNIGSVNFSGYLLIQVQYNNSGTWVVDNDTINEITPRTINASDTLALDLIFNGLVTTDDLTHGDGTYRVYAAFRDPNGNVLICDDESLLEAWWEFTVDTS